MGQYYHPVNIEKKEHLYSHDFGSGLKLMEHSYLHNDFVVAVEVLLSPLGPWHKNKIVWAGDYADPELGEKREDGEDANWYSICEERGTKIAPYDVNQIKKQINIDDYPFVVNHTFKEYVDKRKAIEYGDGWKIHPLPLLTADGNGRGGGDYYEDNPSIALVGYWKKCSISIEKEIPDGYTELFYDFKE